MTAAAVSLIDRLRERAADPERRVDAQETQFFAEVKNLDLGGLLLERSRRLIERQRDHLR